MSEQPAPAAAPANKQTILRGLLGRLQAGEFDPEPGHKDFHQFVVKEIYPLLGNGTLAADDLEKITKAYAGRADPYNTKDETK
jgi:hypothetical protein